MATDAERLDAFLSDPNIPEADKRQAAALARASFNAPADISTWYERAGQYAKGKVEEFGGAMGRLGMDLASERARKQAIEAGAELPDPNRSGWNIAGDVATVAAPVVAPGLTLAGTAVGAGARALGTDEDTADILNAGTQLGAGLGSGVLGARGAVRAAPGLMRGAAKEAYSGIGAAAGKTVLVGNTAKGAKLANDLDEAINWVGAHPREVRAGKTLIQKLYTGGATYQDFDDALAILNKLPKNQPSLVRGLVKQGMMDVLEQTPAGSAARSAADVQWQRYKDVVRRGRQLGQIGTVAGGASVTGTRLAQGDYKGAATAALGTGLALGGLSAAQHPRLIAAGIRGAAGPLARTGVVLSGPAIRAFGEESGGEPVPQDTGTDFVAPLRSSDVQVSKPARGPFGREINAVASLAKIPPEVIHTFIAQESGGNVNALSHPEAGQAHTPAHGILQITPQTFESVKGQTSALLGREASVDNPLDNLLGGALLLRRYLDKSGGDLETTAKLYFGGENPRFWGERTQQYGRDIMGRWAKIVGDQQVAER